MKIKTLKKHIRAFMRNHYTDERLAQLLCHARDGKLAYFSCCCFIGIATADHALEGNIGGAYSESEHYLTAAHLDGALDADRSYCWLANVSPNNWTQPSDEVRRRILIPMIRAEMKRRSSVEPAEPEEVAAPVASQEHVHV